MDYTQIYNRLVARAVDRNWKKSTAPCYVEFHHIVPKCLGGLDDKNNFACLTAREHFLAHLLLVKIFPQESKLIFAANMLTRNHSKHRIHNRDYQWLKEARSKMMSQMYTGRIISDDTKLLMSEAKKGKCFGSNNNFYSKSHSTEFKKLQSERQKIKQMGSGNSNAKLWQIVFPDGSINIINCLKEFCVGIGCSVYQMRNNRVYGYQFCGEIK